MILPAHFVEYLSLWVQNWVQPKARACHGGPGERWGQFFGQGRVDKVLNLAVSADRA